MGAFIKMQKTILIILCLLFFIQVSETKNNNKTAVKINNNKITIKTTIKGHKINFTSPKISKNKYLKMVNIGIN